MDWTIARAIEMMGDKMTARMTMSCRNLLIPGEEIESEDEAGMISAIVAASERLAIRYFSRHRLVEVAKECVRLGICQLGRSHQGAREAMRLWRRPMYVERLLTGSKHVEIQVLADAHGRTIRRT